MLLQRGISGGLIRRFGLSVLVFFANLNAGISEISQWIFSDKKEAKTGSANGEPF